jgi:hypothetical protein
MASVLLDANLLAHHPCHDRQHVGLLLFELVAHGTSHHRQHVTRDLGEGRCRAWRVQKPRLLRRRRCRRRSWWYVVARARLRMKVEGRGDLKLTRGEWAGAGARLDRRAAAVGNMDGARDGALGGRVEAGVQTAARVRVSEQRGVRYGARYGGARGSRHTRTAFAPRRRLPLLPGCFALEQLQSAQVRSERRGGGGGAHAGAAQAHAQARACGRGRAGRRGQARRVHGRR